MVWLVCGGSLVIVASTSIPYYQFLFLMHADDPIIFIKKVYLKTVHNIIRKTKDFYFEVELEPSD
jgi:hypothetical protein